MNTYDELAAFMNTMPRIPRRELKCHPYVTIALRQASGPVPVATPFGFSYLAGNLAAIDIFEDDTLVPGEWFLREDGVTVMSGILEEESEVG